MLAIKDSTLFIAYFSIDIIYELRDYTLHLNKCIQYSFGRLDI